VLEAEPEDPMSFACKFFCDPEREEEVGFHVGGVEFNMGQYK
jgi:hypothetical protein